MEKYVLPEHMVNFGLNIYRYGHEACQPSHSFGPAIRRHYLLHFVISGKGTLHSSEGDWALEAGTVFYIAPYQITTYTADHRYPWEYMWIEVDGLIAERTLELLGLSRTTPIWQASKDDGWKEIKELLSNIVAEDIGNVLKLMGLTCLLFDSMTNNNGAESAAHTGSDKYKNIYVRKAIQFIEARFGEAIGTADIAKHCGVKRSYLTRLFHSEVEMGPKRYLLEFRMGIAKNLLQEGSLPIKYIACSVGYNDQLYFSRVFKEHVGVSPSAWRRLNPATHAIVENEYGFV